MDAPRSRQRPGPGHLRAGRGGEGRHDRSREPASRSALHIHVSIGPRSVGAGLVSGRVLVIDDEVEMQRALRTGLSYHDFDVHAVGSGEEAVREAAARRPDVILLDLGLPGMDGFATLKALRPATRAAVIIVSVMPDEKDKGRALDAGADDYLVKPFA